MERADYEKTITQLIGAAELVASGVSAEDDRMHAFEALAFFRLRRQRIGEAASAVSDDDLFKDSAMAALTMAGRKHFLAAIALLDQARSLTSG